MSEETAVLDRSKPPAGFDEVIQPKKVDRTKPPAGFDTVVSVSTLPDTSKDYSKPPSGEGYPTPAVPGNIQWYDRPVVDTSSLKPGTTGTVYSFSEEENGMEVLVPMIYDGKLHSQKEAWDHYKKTGEHMGKWKVDQNNKDAAYKAADAYGQKYHKEAEAGKFGKFPKKPAKDDSLSLGQKLAGEISAEHPHGRLQKMREALANSSLGHALEQTMPGVADTLHLRPTLAQGAAGSKQRADYEESKTLDPLGQVARAGAPDVYRAVTTPVRGAKLISKHIQSTAQSLDPNDPENRLEGVIIPNVNPELAMGDDKYIEITPEQMTKAYQDVVAPAGEAGAEFLGSMVSPKNFTMLSGFSAVPTTTKAGLIFHAAIGAYFAKQMGEDGLRAAYQTYKDANDGKVPEAVKDAVNAALNLAMAIEGGKGVTDIARYGSLQPSPKTSLKEKVTKGLVQAFPTVTRAGSAVKGAFGHKEEKLVEAEPVETARAGSAVKGAFGHKEEKLVEAEPVETALQKALRVLTEGVDGAPKPEAKPEGKPEPMKPAYTGSERRATDKAKDRERIDRFQHDISDRDRALADPYTSKEDRELLTKHQEQDKVRLDELRAKARGAKQTAGTAEGVKADNDFFQQAKQELGEGASDSQVLMRAQELKEQATKPPKAESVHAETDVRVASVDPDTLVLDPGRMQYKLGGDESGSQGHISGLEWNDELAGVVTVWVDPADGKTYVVNGHNRVALAREPQNIGKVKSLDVKYIEAKTATEARAKGALQNIAENQGTAIDAAKFFRETGATAEQLRAQGIPVTRAIADNGMALARLSEPIFNDVVNERIPMNRAAEIGRITDVPEQQEAILTLIKRAESKGKHITNDVIKELGRRATIAQSVEDTGNNDPNQPRLFKIEAMEKNLALEEAELSDFFRSRIKDDTKLFGVLARGTRADRVKDAKVGSVNKNKAGAKKTESEQALEVYDKESVRIGEVNDIIQRATKEIFEGGNESAIREQAYEAVGKALSEVIKGTTGKNGRRGGAGPKSDPGSPKPEEKPAEVAPEPPSEKRDEDGNLILGTEGAMDMFGGGEPEPEAGAGDKSTQPKQETPAGAVPTFTPSQAEMPKFSKTVRDGRTVTVGKQESEWRSQRAQQIAAERQQWYESLSPEQRSAVDRDRAAKNTERAQREQEFDRQAAEADKEEDQRLRDEEEARRKSDEAHDADYDRRVAFMDGHQQNLEAELRKDGYEFQSRGRENNSRYLTIQRPEDGESVTVRISDHAQPKEYDRDGTKVVGVTGGYDEGLGYRHDAADISIDPESKKTVSDVLALVKQKPSDSSTPPFTAGSTGEPPSRGSAEPVEPPKPAEIPAPKNEPAKPKKSKKITPMDIIREAYKPGSVVEGYGKSLDKVLEFRESPDIIGGWEVKVIGSDKDGNPLPGERVRTHNTRPEKKDFVAATKRLEEKQRVEQAVSKAKDGEKKVDLSADFTSEGLRSRFNIPEDVQIRHLASDGTITRTRDGHWKIAGEKGLERLRKGDFFGEEPAEPEVKAKEGEKLASDDLGIHFARTENGNIKLGADPAALGKILGSSLYKDKAPKVITKELVQNAMDAVRGSKKKTVAVDLDYPNRVITIADSGLGMTREELETVFTDLGSSGKRDQEAASGGFGLAKAAPLMMSKKLEVVSVVEVGGKKIENSFTSTPEQMLGEGVAVQSREVPSDTPTGTRIKAHVEGDLYSAREYIASSRLSLNAPGELEFTENGRISPLADKGKVPKTPAITTNIPGATAKVYTSTTKELANHWGQMPVEVHNNGIYQFIDHVTIPENMRGMPGRIAVDIHATVAEGHPDYPFLANREQLRSEASSAIKKLVKEKILDPLIQGQRDTISELYHSLPKMKSEGYDIPILDSGSRMTTKELEAIQSHPVVKELAELIHETSFAAIERARKTPGMEAFAKNIKRIGLVFSSDVHGVFIEDPKDASHATVFINPFQGIGEDPASAASLIWHTIKHELVHDLVKGHNESFTSAEVQVSRAMGRLEIESLWNLTDAYGGKEGEGFDGNTGIRKELVRPIQLYERSRQRGEASPDLFRSEASRRGGKYGARDEGRDAEGLRDGREATLWDDEPTLPGLEKPVAEQRQAAQEHRDGEVSAEMQQKLSSPLGSVDKAAGEMVSRSPLFRGTDADPQKPMFPSGPSAQSNEPQSIGAMAAKPIEPAQLKDIDQFSEGLRRNPARGTFQMIMDWMARRDVIDPNRGPVQRMKDSLADLPSKAGNTFTNAWDATKVAMSSLWDSYAHLPKWTEFNTITGKWDGALQIAAKRLNDFYDAMLKSVPDVRRREAIANWIHAGGDEVTLQRWVKESTKPDIKRGYENALNLTPDEQTIARNLMTFYDSMFEMAKNNGIETEYLQNYVDHIVQDNPTARKGKKLAAEINFSELKTKPRFTRQRVFETFFEGEKKGYRYAKDIAYLTTVHYTEMSKAIANRAYIKSLLDGVAEDGRPLAMPTRAVTHISKEDAGDPTRFIKPDAQPKNSDGYETVNHPALRKWRWAFTDPSGANIFVEGDIILHPEIAKHVKRTLGKSAVKDYAVGRAILKASQVGKSTMLSFSGFHQTQIGVHALEHMVNPFNVKELDLNDPRQKALVEHGLMVADFHGEQGFSEGVQSVGLAKFIPGVGELAQRYQKYLFRDWIPQVKMTMALDAVERNRGRFAKELKAGKITDDQVLKLSADEANAAFGGMNHRQMGTSKTMNDLLRLVMLSPDFTISRAKFVGQALKPHGGEQRAALLKGALVMYGAARVLNYLINNGDAKWDVKDAFSVVIKGKAYGLRSIQGDILNLIEDPNRFVQYRANPLILKPVIQFLTHKDPYGRYQSNLDLIGSTAKGVGIPLPFKGLLEQNDKTLLDSALQAIGVQEWRYYTPAEALGTEYKQQNVGGHSTPPEESRRASAKYLVEDLYRQARQGKGEDDDVTLPDGKQRLIDEFVKGGVLTQNDVTQAEKMSHISTLESALRYGRLSLSQLLNVYDKASDSEKEAISERIVKKIDKSTAFELRDQAKRLQKSDFKDEYADAMANVDEYADAMANVDEDADAMANVDEE